MLSTANSMIKYSTEVGGAKHVYTDTVKPLQGGFSVAAADLPLSGNVLPAATPILCDEGDNRDAEVHYAFEVLEDVDATHIKVKKYGGSTVAKVGMFLMKAPAAVATTGQGYEITAIDSTDTAFDILTMSGDLGEAAGDTLIEAVAEAADTTIKILPNALSFSDVYVEPNGYDFGITGVFMSFGSVLTRRIAPIAPAIRTYLLENGCFFRYSNSK
jgi:hypothetical protein